MRFRLTHLLIVTVALALLLGLTRQSCEAADLLLGLSKLAMGGLSLLIVYAFFKSPVENSTLQPQRNGFLLLLLKLLGVAIVIAVSSAIMLDMVHPETP